MKVKCEYCDSYIDDTLESCPHCGAPSIHMARSASKEPKTIEELQAFCRAKNINLERMHFHIGENYTAPKAFGIYKDEHGNFVVYKNKADGTRAVRYEGTDEAFAVNEIYQKLKAEVMEVREQAASKGYSRPRPQSTAPQKSTGNKKGCRRGCLIGILVLFLGPIALGLLGLLLQALGITSSASSGYYNYNGNTYYNNGSSWYEYVDDDWRRTDYKDDYFPDYEDHFVDDYTGTPFTSSSTYSGSSGSDSYSSWESSNNWNDDWDDDDWSWDWDDDDDDWDWDSDSSWDSGYDWDSGSDWDSDW